MLDEREGVEVRGGSRKPIGSLLRLQASFCFESEQPPLTGRFSVATETHPASSPPSLLRKQMLLSFTAVGAVQSPAGVVV